MARAATPRSNFDDVVVVTGLPRSGTSLLMQMLAAGGLPLFSDEARPPDPDNPGGYHEHAAVKRTRVDASWVSAARGHGVKVIIPLVRALPEGERWRVLWVRRDLAAVLASQRAMLARRAVPSPASDDAALARAFTDELEQTRRWLDARGDVRWVALEHADLLREPARGAARIADFLDDLVRLDRPRMAAVVDPALGRQGRAAPVPLF